MNLQAKVVEGVPLPRGVFAPRYLREYFTGEKWSDIHDHLPTLLRNAKGNILEIGVRSGVSTSAFIVGTALWGGHVYSIDIEDCSQVFEDENWTFLQGDSRELLLPSEWPSRFDVVFIDANHNYHYVVNDLMRFGTLADRCILLHDYVMSGVKEGVKDFMYDTQRYTLIEHEGSYGLAELRL